MVAGGFALGLAMNGTGLAENAVKSIPFANLNPLLILIVSGLVCYTLSNFISNTEPLLYSSLSLLLYVKVWVTV